MQESNHTPPPVEKPRKKRRRLDADGNPIEEREERIDRLG